MCYNGRVFPLVEEVVKVVFPQRQIQGRLKIIWYIKKPATTSLKKIRVSKRGAAKCWINKIAANALVENSNQVSNYFKETV